MKYNGNIHGLGNNGGWVEPMDNLGISPALIAAGTSFASSMMNDKPGGQPMMPQSPSPTTISPAFQQSFTPQFSPTMQQQQDSPGATQTAIPTQQASTPQIATPTSGEGAMGPILPEQPSPFSRDYERGSFTPTFQDKNNYNDLIKVGILAATALAVAAMFKPKGGLKAIGKGLR